MSDTGPLEHINAVDAFAKELGVSFGAAALLYDRPNDTEYMRQKRQQIIRILSVSLNDLTRAQIEKYMVYAWGSALLTDRDLEEICEFPSLRRSEPAQGTPAYGFIVESTQTEIRNYFRENEPIAFGAIVSQFIRDIVEEAGDNADGFQRAQHAYYVSLLNADTEGEAFRSTIEDLEVAIRYTERLRERFTE